eukprot:m.72404 g.72404  ORF g.72404 m.72404 type:complete len:171 (-) comp20249_c0_seq1:130-642(-)
MGAEAGPDLSTATTEDAFSHPQDLRGSADWVFEIWWQVWSFFELYGWFVFAGLVLLAIFWPKIKKHYYKFIDSLTAPPPVKADENAVLEARMRMQQKAEADAKTNLELMQAKRRANILGDSPPPSKLKPKPIVRRGYGGGFGGGDTGFNPLGGGGGGSGYRPPRRKRGGA